MEEEKTNAIGGWVKFFFERIIVAVLIPLVVFLYSEAQKQIEREATEAQQILELNLRQEREEDNIVAAYVDDMTNIMLQSDFDVELAACGLDTYKPVENQTKMERLIRNRTVLALSQLQSGVRKGQIILFFVDSGFYPLLQLPDLQARDFSGADWWNICMSKQDLAFTSLAQVTLVYANLIEADLLAVDLSNAKLQNANLTNARLLDAVFTENTVFNYSTVLPDGTTWTPETDISRFTDFEHNEYWDVCEQNDNQPWFCREFEQQTRG